MLSRMLGCLATAGLGLAVVTGPATAQTFFQNQSNPYVRPAVSPYVNLARPGSAGVNYYGLVKPQFDSNRQLLNLQQQTFQLSQGQQQQLAPPLGEENYYAYYSITGHTSSFFNQSHYFGQFGIGQGARPTPSQSQFQIPSSRRY